MIRVYAFLLAFVWVFVPQPASAQEAETELEGVTASVVELRRAGNLLRLAVRFNNESAKQAEGARYTAERITLTDVKSRKKYFPLKDATGQYLAGPLGDQLDGGRIALLVPPKQANVVWAYFEPLPAGAVVNVELPYVFPFDNVAVTDGPSKVFTGTGARSTPHGAAAKIVSAKRADQAVNVRLRLEADPGADPELGGAYFEYRNVFLFDPLAKRKYPLLKDADGKLQAQPLTVQMDGGSFIYDWKKPTLVSLTFQAPPDTVTSADLLLPRFLPVEGMAIEGLGGAAAGGVAAAGRAVGLEAALKELNAEVTEKEIKLALSADVLFDFDKADVKKDAEPSLRNLATVVTANPGATVLIEGHTDGKGADAYNQTLSEQRAAAVKQWLVTNAAATGATITTRGWGKSKPVAPNTSPDGGDSAEGRAKNRRVEVTVRKGA